MTAHWRSPDYRYNLIVGALSLGLIVSIVLAFVIWAFWGIR